MTLLPDSLPLFILEQLYNRLVSTPDGLQPEVVITGIFKNQTPLALSLLVRAASGCWRMTWV